MYEVNFVEFAQSEALTTRQKGGAMSKETSSIKQARRKRWERQRREAITREQIEVCYKQYTPPQCKEVNRHAV